MVGTLDTGLNPKPPKRSTNPFTKQVPKARPLLLFRLGLSLGKLLLLFDPTTSNNNDDEDVKVDEQQPPQQPTAAAASSSASASLGETAALVRALAQLFEVRGHERVYVTVTATAALTSLHPKISSQQELDFHYANGAVQSMRLLLARPADGPYPDPRTRLAVGQPQHQPTTAPALSQQSPPRQRPPSPTPASESTEATGSSGGSSTSALGEPLAVALQPRLLRFGSDIAYEAFYATPAPPFPLSYPLVIDSLARVLTRVYALLGGPRHGPVVVAQPAVFEAVVRVDALVCTSMRVCVFMGVWEMGWAQASIGCLINAHLHIRIHVHTQVKHHVINPLAKDLTSLATTEAKREIDWLRQQYLGGGGGGGAGGGGGGSVVV